VKVHVFAEKTRRGHSQEERVSTKREDPQNEKKDGRNEGDGSHPTVGNQRRSELKDSQGPQKKLDHRGGIEQKSRGKTQKRLGDPSSTCFCRRRALRGHIHQKEEKTERGGVCHVNKAFALS